MQRKICKPRFKFACEMNENENVSHLLMGFDLVHQASTIELPFSIFYILYMCALINM